MHPRAPWVVTVTLPLRVTDDRYIQRSPGKGPGCFQTIEDKPWKREFGLRT